MNTFDKTLKNTLEEMTENLQPTPHLKEKIDTEILRSCPELRKKIAVIFGGCSPEYSVSLQSAYAVISHMNTLNTPPC